MPAIVRIEVQKNAQKSPLDNDPGVSCADFVFRPQGIRDYFARARLIAPETRVHDLDWTSCTASGTMTLAGGRRWDWVINSAGVASIYEKGRLTRRFGCEDCDQKPFAFDDPPP